MGRRPSAGRSGNAHPVKQVAALIIGTAAVGYLAVRTAMVLAELRPYFGGYWYAGVAAGAAVAIGVPALSLRAMARRGLPTWSLVLLGGDGVAALLGMRWFSLARVRTVPLPRVLPPPPPGVLFELTAIAFTAVTLAGLTLITGLTLALSLAPALRERLHQQVRRRSHRAISTAGVRPGPDTGFPEVPVRLRLPDPAGDRPWLRGSLQVTPGSVQWVPASGSGAVPVELMHATLIPAQRAARPAKAARPRRFLAVDTPAGRVHLKLDPGLLELAQQAAASMPACPAETATRTGAAPASGRPGGAGGRRRLRGRGRRP